jgi:glycosyltransferase involved in cell wall biosynthesis
MRIFMLVQPPGARGPVGKHTSYLVAALRSLGCTVETHPWGRRMENVSLREMVAQRAHDVRSVRRSLKGRSFDIAVVKTAHDWRTLIRDLAVVLAVRRRCRPIVLQLHGSRASALVRPGRPLFKLATALLLSLVDGIMVLSTEEQRQWMSFRRRPRVVTVKNPYIRRDSASPSAGSSEGTTSDRVLFVGRLIEEKGIFDLVKALPRVLEETPCHLVVVGEGDREADLRDRVRSLALEDHATILGYRPPDEVAKIYRECTVFALPTRWDEGFPTVLAEALDAGLPIITTRVRGAADHLVENENALFVEAGDITGLSAALISLLRDHKLRRRMQSANRELIRIFEPEVVAQEYLQALQTFVSDAPA